MKIPVPFKNKIMGLIHKKAISIVKDVIIEKVKDYPVAEDIIVAISKGATVKECVIIYTQYTETSTDDKVQEIMGKIVHRANIALFMYDREAINVWLRKVLTSVTIPDFDDKIDNNIVLNDLLFGLIKEIADKKQVK
jgi:hypothetical protein